MLEQVVGTLRQEFGAALGEFGKQVGDALRQVAATQAPAPVPQKPAAAAAPAGPYVEPAARPGWKRERARSRKKLAELRETAAEAVAGHEQGLAIANAVRAGNSDQSVLSQIAAHAENPAEIFAAYRQGLGEQPGAVAAAQEDRMRQLVAQLTSERDAAHAALASRGPTVQPAPVAYPQQVPVQPMQPYPAAYPAQMPSFAPPPAPPGWASGRFPMAPYVAPVAPWGRR